MRLMDLSRARLAVAAGFLTQGLILLSLTTRLPDFQDKWHLSDVTLSLVLLMMILLAGVGSVVAEKLAKRLDSAVLLRSGFLVIAVAVPLICLAPTMAVYVAGIAAYGVGLGIVDASTNMQAVALEHRYGRPILPSFHGAWTLGGVIGAGIGFGTAELPVEVNALVGLIPLAVAFGPFLPRDHGPTELPTEVAVPWRPIILVGIAMVLFYMVDTGVQTWGPLFLDHTFTTPERYVALSALAYLLASGAVRIAGDRLVARLGVVVVLRVGALVGAGGLAVVVFSPTWQVAVVGFAVLGAGVAVVAPLSFSAAARIAGASEHGEEFSPAVRQARVDAVIARFNQFNYVGALLGSVMTGLVGSGDLRIGFAVPMILVLGIIPLAPAFVPKIAAAVGRPR